MKYHVLWTGAGDLGDRHRLGNRVGATARICHGQRQVHVDVGSSSREVGTRKLQPEARVVRDGFPRVVVVAGAVVVVVAADVVVVDVGVVVLSLQATIPATRSRVTVRCGICFMWCPRLRQRLASSGRSPE